MFNMKRFPATYAPQRSQRYDKLHYFNDMMFLLIY